MAVLLCGLLVAACNRGGENKAHYASSKPLTRWWWFARVIKQEDVKYNLDWVKKNGFGGVEIVWIYPLNRKRFYSEPLDTNYLPRQEWLSPEWTAVVTNAKHYADSLGLSCDFTFGTGWPFGDTKVNREDATQTWHEKNDSLKWTYAVVSWEYPKKGYIINHMDQRAFGRYAQRMGSALAPALKGSASGLFCDSWEVETTRIWTTGFGEAFKRSYGYDIEPYMDSIYSRANFDERYDYMKLVSEYVVDRFYRPFTNECHLLGAFSRVQCAGAPVDLISAYASVDVPETEAMLYEPPYSRIVASAACLTSKKEVSSETFTCTYGFPRYDAAKKKMDFRLRGKEQVADLKLVADALVANGVNQVIWHGMPFNPVGIDTIMFYASVHVGRKGNLAKDIPALNAYMEKICGYMKRGVTFSEVAVYLPVEDSWETGMMKDPDPQQPWAWGEYEMRRTVPPAELRGYNPIWISGNFLRNASVRDKKLVCGDETFSVLYIDASYVDLNALKTIVKLAGKGLTICLRQLPKQPGKNKSPEFGKLLAELSGMKNVSRDFPGMTGIRPLVKGDSLPEFWCRRDGEEYYFFIANPKSMNLHLPLKYGQSLSSGAVRRDLTFNVNGRELKTIVEFRPYQSVMLQIGKQGNPEYLDISYDPPVPVTIPY
ncbi:MAG: glycosyl hydrolase [Bacteroidetes bacterium]|nr:glycosyl hydrolase [Bacteroidota bacterium]